MTTLNRIHLLNVMLFMNEDVIPNFILVNKKCKDVSLMIKRNTFNLKNDIQKQLKYFPNIQTLSIKLSIKMVNYDKRSIEAIRS